MRTPLKLALLATVLPTPARPPAVEPPTAPHGYYRSPAIRGETIVFTAEGDLWTISIQGGEARRLTTHAAEESHAAISPDGTTLAFSAGYEGPTEVYTLPLEGGVRGRNDKGLVTYDRKVKKDAFYFYKANWSDEPVLYICSRRFVARTNAVTDVKIYSNATKVELLVNGKSRGTQKPIRDGTFIWKDVPLSVGENQVEAKAARRGQALEDRCVWTLK